MPTVQMRAMNEVDGEAAAVPEPVFGSSPNSKAGPIPVTTVQNLALVQHDRLMQPVAICQPREISYSSSDITGIRLAASWGSQLSQTIIFSSFRAGTSIMSGITSSKWQTPRMFQAA